MRGDTQAGGCASFWGAETPVSIHAEGPAEPRTNCTLYRRDQPCAREHIPIPQVPPFFDRLLRNSLRSSET